MDEFDGMDESDVPIYDRAGNKISVRQWGILKSDRSYCVVARTKIDKYLVSTVWLGIDHAFGGGDGPLIFETMVFITDDDELLDDCETRRYRSEEEALAGHTEISNQVSLLVAAMQ